MVIFQLFKYLCAAAAIEAPLTLFKEPIEIILFDTVEFTQMSFCLVPEVLLCRWYDCRILERTYYDWSNDD